MTNEVTIVGLVTKITHSHFMRNEKYYSLSVLVKRDSGAFDVIPVISPERVLVLSEYVAIKGVFRSYSNNGKLTLYVFAKSMVSAEPDNINDVFLEGVINKVPIHRFTPYGREITDILLRVDRTPNKYDRIPCIAWGRTANMVSRLEVGNRLRVAGRIQSRNYKKDGQIKVAYELSIYLVESVQALSIFD